MRLYRDPETGRVYERIRDALGAFCDGQGSECTDNCPLYYAPVSCNRYAKEHPAECARRMGFEVFVNAGDTASAVDDTTTALDDTPTAADDTTTTVDDTPAGDKPRLAEVLGVEVGERFGVRDENGDVLGPFVINASGRMVFADDPDTSSDEAVYIAINHPESVLPGARLTMVEAAVMRGVGARWVSLDGVGTSTVDLWDEKPVLRENGVYYPAPGRFVLATVRAEMFPSVGRGECVGLEENGG